MTDPTFESWLTWTVNTFRSPAAVGGIVEAQVANLTGATLVKFMPVSLELVERYSIDAPVETFVSYTEGLLDFVEGDRVVVTAADNTDVSTDRTFRVVGVGEWRDDETNDFLEIVLEEVKGS